MIKFMNVCGIHSSLMMEAVRTSETSVDNNFTRQYIPEDNSEQCVWRYNRCQYNAVKGFWVLTYDMSSICVLVSW
jgi:hypothetical protein